MAEERIAVYDGKYEFYMKNHSLHCLRYGEEWREFIGDGAVLQLFLHAVEIEEQLKQSKIPMIPPIPAPVTYKDGNIESVRLAILASVEEKPVLICNSVLLDWADRLDVNVEDANPCCGRPDRECDCEPKGPDGLN